MPELLKFLILLIRLSLMMEILLRIIKEVNYQYIEQEYLKIKVNIRKLLTF